MRTSRWGPTFRRTLGRLCAQSQAPARAGPGSGPTDRIMYRAHGRWYRCAHRFSHQHVDDEPRSFMEVCVDRIRAAQ